MSDNSSDIQLQATADNHPIIWLQAELLNGLDNTYATRRTELRQPMHVRAFESPRGYSKGMPVHAGSGTH
jgi:hypothetical protein